MVRAGRDQCHSHRLEDVEKQLSEAQNIAQDRLEMTQRMAERYKESEKQLSEARAELEVERMRLAACGVAAMANTKESAEKVRISDSNPYWSASYYDVCSAIDREMILREEREQWGNEFTAVCLAKQERDEARAEVENLKKKLEYFENTLCLNMVIERSGSGVQKAIAHEKVVDILKDRDLAIEYVKVLREALESIRSLFYQKYGDMVDWVRVNSDGFITTALSLTPKSLEERLNAKKEVIDAVEYFKENENTENRGFALRRMWKALEKLKALEVRDEND